MMSGSFNDHVFTLIKLFSLRGLVDTLSFKSKHVGLEEGLGCSESDSDGIILLST